MFTAGDDELVNFVLTKVVDDPAIADAELVKKVIHDLFQAKVYRGCIVRSPERPDLQLSQEEAMGFLLAALAGIELLASEARITGKTIHNRVASEKKAKEKAHAKTKSDKSNARAAAKKDPELAELLSTTIGDLDSNEAADHAARRKKSALILLPTAPRRRPSSNPLPPPPPHRPPPPPSPRASSSRPSRR